MTTDYTENTEKNGENASVFFICVTCELCGYPGCAYKPVTKL